MTMIDQIRKNSKMIYKQKNVELNELNANISIISNEKRNKNNKEYSEYQANLAKASI